MRMRHTRHMQRTLNRTYYTRRKVNSVLNTIAMAHTISFRMNFEYIIIYSKTKTKQGRARACTFSMLLLLWLWMKIPFMVIDVRCSSQSPYGFVPHMQNPIYIPSSSFVSAMRLLFPVRRPQTDTTLIDKHISNRKKKIQLLLTTPFPSIVSSGFWSD